MERVVLDYRSQKNLSSVFCHLFSVIRYRFFLFAGIFPYLMGQVLAFNTNRHLNGQIFGLGFLGIFLVLIGVELFNEYFDAKEGGDRIFLTPPFLTQNRRYFVERAGFILGIFVFLSAFLIGLYLSLRAGWLILLFSFLGFLGAYFYVGPPIRWAYRGFGELAIALSYGPCMVLGSFYLQTKRIDTLPIFISLILGLLIFSLALVNEIPDYFQDRLVGKRNIVVRLGKKASLELFSLTLLCVFILLFLGIGIKLIPLTSLAIFLLSPFVFKSINIAKNFYEYPKFFLPAIRITILNYIIIVSILGISYIAA